MSQTIKDSNVSVKTHQTYQPASYQSGILDLCLGLFFLVLGSLWPGKYIWLVPLAGITLWPIYHFLQKTLVAPRLPVGERVLRGADSFQARLAKWKIVYILTIIVGIGAFTIVFYRAILGMDRAIFLDAFLLFIGMFIAIMFGLVGLINRIKRFFGYALWAAALTVAARVVEISTALSFTLVGLLLVLVGLLLLVRLVLPMGIDS